MSVHDFREIFRRETDAMLARLQQKSFEHSRLRSAEVSPASTCRGDTADLGGSTLGPELAHMGELQRLANDMVESVLQRVSNNASSWADVSGAGAMPNEPAAALALRKAAEEEGAAARERRRARIQELEAEAKRRHEEETRLRAELALKCKAENELALQAQEEKLNELRRRAGGFEGAESQREAAELQHEFAEHVTRIHSNMALTRDAVSRLEGRMKGLERIEGQQRKPLSPMEALLARAAPGGGADPLDDLDNPLVEAIRRGEQVCKRMRRSLSGA
uniref:Uncharacterized protein n=1 Tax=Alexandrium catenella TaxID=2925 RepID=A0A7S1WKU0_ALECA|mmetsp:Transcript_70326/g.186912  ORF Transcript_70326/g.186912 Transcript_70326/m.186912 type:complete len:277 (+) Transcript_70326:86-916(+)|eukprot:CAMPEP_0171255264 /NCGR_PEP_ID=MMETSP0790-20130122/52677_1 /TAXON_ID=2925 /ORGANISM="Alexandrium catenella, Strain OF101" /LENGTH=276 /DNA_ID=CAMNT_0011723211 /DNA_START=20 /DNA_END=850 /DNA_ORIENTATION=-